MHRVELGTGVFAFCDPVSRFGSSNVGLVIDADGLTVIDTTATPAAGAAVSDTIHALTAELGLPTRRVVLTSSRVAFCGGSTAFRKAAFYGSDATSEQLDAPPHPDALRRLLPHLAPAYGNDFTTRAVTHTVSEPAWLSGAAQGLPLPGESAANLVVQVPGADVVFAGALASFGVTPLAYDGDLLHWIDSLQELRSLASTIVPGHGPVGGAVDLDHLTAYLVACVDADGDPAGIPPGPWDTWSDRRFDTVNVERAARLATGDDSIPDTMFELLGLRPDR
jgi:cyclase